MGASSDREKRKRRALSDAGERAMEWRDSTRQERGQALVQLLLLADALPATKRKYEPLEFPRLDSTRYPCK
jgi:hypothetical protein